MYDNRDDETFIHPMEAVRQSTRRPDPRRQPRTRAATYVGRDHLSPTDTEYVNWIINGDN